MPELIGAAEQIMGESPPASTYNENGNGLAFFQSKSGCRGKITCYKENVLKHSDPEVQTFAKILPKESNK